jgi:hypothetical protein
MIIFLPILVMLMLTPLVAGISTLYTDLQLCDTKQEKVQTIVGAIPATVGICMFYVVAFVLSVL